MRKSQVFTIIDDLLQKRKFQAVHKDPKKPDFIKDYYQEYFRKKKLSPKRHNYKINQLMKNFEKLETYVNASSLMQELQQKLACKTGPRQKPKKEQPRLWAERSATEPSADPPNYLKSMRRAADLLKTSYKVGNFLQLNKCDQIVEQLENQSNQMCNIKYRNNSHELIYHNLVGEKYVDGKKRSLPMNLRRVGRRKFEQSVDGLCFREGEEAVENEQEEEGQEREGLQLENSQKAKRLKLKKCESDSSQILNMASSCLQMILEREYKKKWGMSRTPSRAVSYRRIETEAGACPKTTKEGQHTYQELSVMLKREDRIEEGQNCAEAQIAAEKSVGPQAKTNPQKESDKNSKRKISINLAHKGHNPKEDPNFIKYRKVEFSDEGNSGRSDQRLTDTVFMTCSKEREREKEKPNRRKEIRTESNEQIPFEMKEALESVKAEHPGRKLNNIIQCCLPLPKKRIQQFDKASEDMQTLSGLGQKQLPSGPEKEQESAPNKDTKKPFGHHNNTMCRNRLKKSPTCRENTHQKMAVKKQIEPSQMRKKVLSHQINNKNCNPDAQSGLMDKMSLGNTKVIKSALQTRINEFYCTIDMADLETPLPSKMGHEKVQKLTKLIEEEYGPIFDAGVHDQGQAAEICQARVPMTEWKKGSYGTCEH